MVSPRVAIKPRAALVNPLYCVGYAERNGMKRILAPPRKGVPAIVTFETLHDAQEACRIATFCDPDRQMVVDGVAHSVDGIFSVVMTSHADLAAGGWVRYIKDTCVRVPDNKEIRITKSDAYLGHAPLDVIATRLQMNL